jgi:hypothetical protein
VFRRLAVFAGGWTIEAGAAIAIDTVVGDGAVHNQAALERFAGLLEKSLITSAPAREGEAGRFGMLETIRAYAGEQLAASGEEVAIRDRHANYFLALAAGAPGGVTGAGQASWLDRLDRDHPNLRAVLDHLLASGRAAEAARLGWDLGWFWFIGGHGSEGRRWMARVLNRPDALGPDERARALCTGAVLAFLQGDFGEAIAAADEALGLLDTAGDDSVRAQVLLVRAIAAVGLGDSVRAAADAAASAAIYRALEEPWGIGQALLVTVHLAAAAGDLAQASAIQAEAERAMRAAGAPWGIAYALNMRVLIAQLAGDLLATVAPLREGVILSRSIGDTIALYYGLTGLAGVEVFFGSGEQSARLFGAAEVLREQTGLVMPNPANQAIYAEHLAALRARLTLEAFSAAWQAGRAMPLAAAIEEALRVGPQRAGSAAADA